MRIYLIRILIGTAVLVSTVPFLFSQEKITQFNFENYNFRINPESKKYFFINDEKISNSDSVSSIESTKKFRMKKSPWKAVLFSAVMPGAGQLYNESYWKIPIVLGLCTYFGYEIYNNHKKYTDYRSQYAESQVLYPPYGDANLQSLRNFYFDQRNDFIWYFMIAYVVNLVDAYVDAQLFDFDVSDEKYSELNFRKQFKFSVGVKF